MALDLTTLFDVIWNPDFLLIICLVMFSYLNTHTHTHTHSLSLSLSLWHLQWGEGGMIWRDTWESSSALQVTVNVNTDVCRANVHTHVGPEVLSEGQPHSRDGVLLPIV